VLASLGHTVELVEGADRLGGTLRLAALVGGRARLGRFADWLEAEVRRLGVRVRTDRRVGAGEVEAAVRGGRLVLLATGSLAGPRRYTVGPGVDVVEVVDLLERLRRGRPLDDGLAEGPVAVFDPVGDAVGVGVAEQLAAHGRPTSIISQDPVIGTQLARTGDLADANVRLQRAGVTLHRRSLLVAASAGRLVLRDAFTAQLREVGCAVLVHCGHRVPNRELGGPDLPTAGDRVAPRTVYEAVLEGRRAALELAARAPVGARS
jgi:hypothetical protein